MNTSYIQFPRENIPWSIQPDKRVDAQSEIVVSAGRNQFAAMDMDMDMDQFANLGPGD